MIKFPAPYTDVDVGGSGKYLIFNLESIKKLAVFDVFERKVVKYIDVGAYGLCAAGANTVVFVAPEQKIIRSWDLTSFKRKLTVSLDLPSVPSVLAMGAASDGPILVGGGESLRGGYQLLDLRKLKPIKIMYAQGEKRRRFEVSSRSRVRVSANGRVFTTWRTAISPSGFFVMTVDGTRVETRYEHTSVGYITPSPNGSRIYTAKGIYTPKIKLIGENSKMFAKNFPFPAVQGDYFLRLQRTDQGHTSRSGKKPSISIHMAGHDGAIFTVPEVGVRGGNYSDFFSRDAIALDQRVYFIPQANVLALLPATNDSVVLQTLNLDEELDKSGIDYLFVTSSPPRQLAVGERLKYQLTVKSKHGDVLYKLESGPSNMKLSKEGMLTWAATTKDTSPQNVIVVVSDASGQEVFHTFNLEIAPRTSRRRGAAKKTAAKPRTIKTPRAVLRTWTDTTGRFRIRARFVKRVGVNIYLKLASGEEKVVPLAKFSKTDQEYLRRMLAN